MNAKISMFVICVEAVIYLLLYNLHDSNFNFLNFMAMLYIHCEKCRYFTRFPGAEILQKGTVSETMWKLCLSAKFPHQEIR